MGRLLSSIVGGLAIVCASTSVNAEVIDFSELAGGFKSVNPLSSGGFLFSNDCGYGAVCLGFYGSSSTYTADPGGTLSAFYGGSTTTMTKIGAGSFDFRSIDLADLYNTGASVTVAFKFIYAGGGSSSVSVTLDHNIGLEKFIFNQTGLSSASWTNTGGDNPWIQFDNVNVAAVPEPDTCAMMFVGLLLVGTTIRRRKVT